MTKTSRVLGVVVGVTMAVSAIAWVRGTAGQPATRTVTVTGVVVEPPADGRMTVAHGEIAGFMPAMTMPFPVDPKDAARLSAGDRVRFRLRVSDAGSHVEDVVVTGREQVPGGTSVRVSSAPRLKPGHPVPAFSLVDQLGRSFDADELSGRVTAVTFVFTRCPVPEFCPMTVSRFRQLQAALVADDTLRARAQLLSVTLDPEFDTPPVLSAYARAVGADSAHWRFLTGRPEAVTALARAFAIHAERTGAFVDHTLATAVLDARGRVAQIWRGSGWSGEEVLAVMRTVAASEAGMTPRHP